jgi:hypothetical protein
MIPPITMREKPIHTLISIRQEISASPADLGSCQGLLGLPAMLSFPSISHSTLNRAKVIFS